MADDPFLRPWSTMAADPDGWIQREVRQERGPTRAICVAGDDRPQGRVALRLPKFASEAVRCAAVGDSDQPAGELSYWLLPEARGRGLAHAAVGLMIRCIVGDLGLRSLVLDIEDGNVASVRVAERLGAERRAPARVQADRAGVARTLVVYVLRLGPAGVR